MILIFIDFGTFQKVLFSVISNSLFWHFLKSALFQHQPDLEKVCFLEVIIFVIPLWSSIFFGMTLWIFYAFSNLVGLSDGSTIPFPIPSRIPTFQKMHEFNFKCFLNSQVFRSFCLFSKVFGTRKTIDFHSFPWIFRKCMDLNLSLFVIPAVLL